MEDIPFSDKQMALSFEREKKNATKKSLVARKLDEELPNACLSQGAYTMQDKSYNYSYFAFYCQSKCWRIHAHR